jgi:hypothetical protein
MTFKDVKIRKHFLYEGATKQMLLLKLPVLRTTEEFEWELYNSVNVYTGSLYWIEDYETVEILT